MLTGLSIRDVVLIESLDLEFGPGLGVLTGETGAGKSILLDALGLALGARADSGLVRQGQAQAVVTVSFDFRRPPRLRCWGNGSKAALRPLVVRRSSARRRQPLPSSRQSASATVASSAPCSSRCTASMTIAASSTPAATVPCSTPSAESTAARRSRPIAPGARPKRLWPGPARISRRPPATASGLSMRSAN